MPIFPESIVDYPNPGKRTPSVFAAPPPAVRKSSAFPGGEPVAAVIAFLTAGSCLDQKLAVN
jgi:hypothetical protein